MKNASDAEFRGTSKLKSSASSRQRCAESASVGECHSTLGTKAARALTRRSFSKSARSLALNARPPGLGANARGIIPPRAGHHQRGLRPAFVYTTNVPVRGAEPILKESTMLQSTFLRGNNESKRKPCSSRTSARGPNNRMTAAKDTAVAAPATMPSQYHTIGIVRATNPYRTARNVGDVGSVSVDVS